MNEEDNYELTIRTNRNTFKFITELKDLKELLQQMNYKDIESVELTKRKIKNGKS